MATPTTPAPAAGHLYQGRREPLRPFACLLCRQMARPADADRFRRLFAETGICGLCHDALDAWATGRDSPSPPRPPENHGPRPLRGIPASGEGAVG